MHRSTSRLAAALGLVLVAPLALAGCSSGADATSSSGGKTELTFLTWSNTKAADGSDVVQNIVKKYEADHPDVTITVNVQAPGSSTDYLKKLDLMQAGGQTADLIQLPSYREYAARASQGYFADITDLAGDYDATYAYPAAVDTKIYALPYDPALYLTFINKSMLDAAGEKLPQPGWTWDDYAALAKKLTHGDGADKVYGSYMHTWPEFRHEGLYNSVKDNPYIKEDGTSNLGDPQFADWLTYMSALENDGVQVPYKDAKATSMAYATEFLGGHAAMLVMGSWMFDSIIDTAQYPHDFQTVFAPFPVFDGGKPGVTQGSASYVALGSKIDDAKKKAAYDFLAYFVDQGAASQNRFSSKKGADNAAVLAAKFQGAEKLVDVPSAQAIWQDKNLVANMVTRDADKFVEIDAVFDKQTDAYLLGSQDLKTTMKTIKDQAEPIVSRP